MHIVLLCSDWAKQMESKAHDTDFKEIGIIPFHSHAFRDEQAYEFFLQIIRNIRVCVQCIVIESTLNLGLIKVSIDSTTAF